ncbi:MAG TPA: MFS transporter, partial [Candidatus Brocadiia bacterium]|nr:MFS transporter [Candidatus Brocadiia bacterium]
MTQPAPLEGQGATSRQNLLLFFVGVALLGMAGGMFETTFNNFIADTFHLTPDERGFLEFPRELPGFLTAVLAGALFFLPETGIGAAAAAAVSVGMVGLAAWGSRWAPMLVFLTLWSAGAHLMMPVRSSLSMELASKGQKGRRLGQAQGASIAASIAGCAVVWAATKALPGNYALIMILGAVPALVAALAFWRMKMPGARLKRAKFVWRRQYWLYYVLAFLFGARKQIFITFGPWVLVKVFNQQADVFAKLWMAAAVLGTVFQPALGRAIDRFGERTVLVADSMFILLICVGYGFADRMGHQGLALWTLYACFVADQLLFGVNMARDTYLAKIALRHEDVRPSLSLGVTINHAVSMTVPYFGGLLWVGYGHWAVFAAAAGVAAMMFVFS